MTPPDQPPDITTACENAMTFLASGQPGHRPPAVDLDGTDLILYFHDCTLTAPYSNESVGGDLMVQPDGVGDPCALGYYLNELRGLDAHDAVQLEEAIDDAIDAIHAYVHNAAVDAIDRLCPPCWGVSFTDPSLPVGQQHLGTCVVQVYGDIEDVLTVTHTLGINPGGQANVIGPMPYAAVPLYQPLNVLLTATDMAALATEHEDMGPQRFDGEPVDVQSTAEALAAVLDMHTRAPDALAPMACCPTDREPLVATMEFRGAEFVCMVCGTKYGFLSAIGRPITPELQARHDELRARYETERDARKAGEQ